MLTADIARPTKTPTPEASLPLLLTRRDAAKLLQISERGLIDLERDGLFRPVRLRTAVRYTRESLEASIHRLAVLAGPSNKLTMITLNVTLVDSPGGNAGRNRNGSQRPARSFCRA
jgi:hypothetical protein